MTLHQFGACERAVAAFIDVLKASWPSSITYSSLAEIGNCDPDSLLRAVQMLSDQGLVSYEATRRHGRGVEVIDAALTARGRETLRQAA